MAIVDSSDVVLDWHISSGLILELQHYQFINTNGPFSVNCIL